MTKRIKLLIEGKGEVEAATSLLCKTASSYGKEIIVVRPPIRAGEAKKLRRKGELERHIALTASHDVDEIFVLLDLDDGCAAKIREEFLKRGEPTADRKGMSLKVCFCVREFEAWFLNSLDALSSELNEYGIDASTQLVDASRIRGAKEELNKRCRGKGYKPTRDQNVFVKSIDVKQLFCKDRSFRKFVKNVTDMPYDELDNTAAHTDC